jgi:hypothetical protein
MGTCLCIGIMHLVHIDGKVKLKLHLFMMKCNYFRTAANWVKRYKKNETLNDLVIIDNSNIIRMMRLRQ